MENSDKSGGVAAEIALRGVAAVVMTSVVTFMMTAELLLLSMIQKIIKLTLMTSSMECRIILYKF